MILVTGATGTVGREVVVQLVAKGQKVRALTRDPKKARFDATVEVAEGDFDRPETLAKAAAGVDGVFSLSMGPQLGAHEGALANAAKKAGAKRIVKLSVMGAGSGAESALVKWHDAGEQAIRDSGVAWTFLRPVTFMSNALQWATTVKAQGKIFLPYGDGALAPIHPRDIAAVAATTLTSAGHEGKIYALTGPEALTLAAQAEILSEAIGKPVSYVPLTDEAARDGMLKSGLPPPLVDALLKMAGQVRAGQAATVLPTVEQVTSRKALTFREWARDNAAAFK